MPKITATKAKSTTCRVGVLASLLVIGFSLLPSIGFAKSVASGEKIVVSEESKDGKPFCVSHITVNARPEKVWHILADYNHAAHTFPMLKQCELLQDHGTTKIVKHGLVLSGVPGTFDYIVTIKETAPREMEWHRLSGDFREVDAVWTLEPLDGGRATLVTYASHISAFLVPQALVKHQFQLDMPPALIALKNQAEIETQIASRKVEHEVAE